MKKINRFRPTGQLISIVPTLCAASDGFMRKRGLIIAVIDGMFTLTRVTIHPHPCMQTASQVP